uniref:Uncharacterized protein n=1 Tax=Dulem virus 42 TaxID=3145760 RepID=A0AAU8B831_9CAUD
MAKDTKKAVETKAVEASNVENIEEQILSKNKLETSLVEEAEKEIKKETDDRKKSQLKTAILEANYINSRELLELRKHRKEEKVRKKALEDTLVALNELKGGKFTPIQYENRVKEIVKEKRNSFKEIEENHSTLIKELRNNFPSYYSLEWEYNNWTENRASRYDF